MQQGRSWGMVFVVGALVAAGIASAQGVVGEEDIKNAVHTIKSAAVPELAKQASFKLEFKKARTLLIKNQQEAYGEVVKLLDEHAFQTRLNAAIILTAYAGQENPAAGLADGLKRCAGDGNDGVRYWGLRGTLASKVSTEQKRAALAGCLEMSRPRELRIPAAMAAEKYKFVEGAPVLLAHLQNLLPEYKKQVAQTLARPVRVRRRDGLEEDDELDRDERMRRPDRLERDRRPIDARRPIDVRRPEMSRRRPPGRVGVPERPGSRPPVGRGRDFEDMIEPGYEEDDFAEDGRGGPRMPTIGKGKDRKIDTTRLSERQALFLIDEIQWLEVYQELQIIGAILEQLVITRPQEPFGFAKKIVPPWELDKCVEKAVIHLQGGAATKAPENADDKGAPAPGAPATP